MDDDARRSADRSASAKEPGVDKWTQYALTVEGKIGDFDITYAGAYMDRPNHGTSDYTDYAEAYDKYYEPSGGIANYYYYFDDAGNPIVPLQYITGGNHFKKLSQELRVATPADKPFRVIAGAFYHHQINEILQEYHVDNLAADLSVNGRPGTDLADEAASRRPRLCAVRRGEFRRHAADHADWRRPLLQVQQHCVRIRRLRPQPGFHPGRERRSDDPDAAERGGQHQDRRRAMLHDQRRFAARIANSTARTRP